MKIENQTKKTLDESFDVVAVINKTYQNSTEYDLNDSLIFLGNVITKTKTKNKELVKKNFSKFVECRIVLEEILEDMKNKGLDKTMSQEVLESIKTLQTKFRHLTGTILDRSKFDTNRDKRLLITKRFKTLFNLKEALESNYKHKVRFVMIYQEGAKQYEELKESKYVQRLWEDVRKIRNSFLEDLYKEIQSKNSLYSEVLYYFDLYFRVGEAKTDRKIMNTLLVNFKEKVLDLPFVNKGLFLRETNHLFIKTIVHLDKDLQKELAKHLIERIEFVFKSSSLPFIKIWLKTYKVLIQPVEVCLEVRSSYVTLLKYLIKSLMTSKLTARLSPDDLLVQGGLFDELLEKEDKYIILSRLLEVIKDKINIADTTNSVEVGDLLDDLNKFDNLFRANSENYDDLQEIKKDIANNEIRKEIRFLSKFIQTNNNPTALLMELVRIIKRAPKNYLKIFKGVSPALEKDKVILWFVNNLIETECPVLNNQQQEVVDKLTPQFGYLKTL